MSLFYQKQYLYFLMISISATCCTMRGYTVHRMPNDWCLQMQSDKQELKLEMTDEELKALSKEKIKEKVKTACREAAFLYLKKEKEKVARKLGKINYPQLCMQGYLQTNDMNIRLKKFGTTPYITY